MGARSSRVQYSEWDLDRLAQISGLQRTKLDRLHSDYNQAAGHNSELNMKEFIKLYSRLPEMQKQDAQQMKQQASRIFRTFDRDQTNTLSFEEFLSAIVLINHSIPRQDRIDYLIRQHNIDKRQQNDEHISSQYGHQIFRRLMDYYGLPSGREHQYWKQVDQQKRGYVTQEEFIDYISRHPDFNKK